MRGCSLALHQSRSRRYDCEDRLRSLAVMGPGTSRAYSRHSSSTVGACCW